MKNIDSDLIRGNIDTIILKTMLNEDKYGLDIIKEVEQRSNGTYELKQPTLYSCLKRLENQELISSYWLNSDIGGKRHYYKLTEKGRDFYNKKQEEWAKSKFVIDNLLSNYNYEEYRLVKKEDYDKAMNLQEDRTSLYSETRKEEIQNDEFFNDNGDLVDDEDPEIEESEKENFGEGISVEETSNFGLDDEDEQSDFDESFDNNQYDNEENTDDYDYENSDEQDLESYEETFVQNDESENEELDEDDSRVYVSANSNYEEDDDEEDEIDNDSPSYDLEDQTENENNILNMLRMQKKEEINTYEGDKKSYAHQIKSIYDDVKYVQDDMICALPDDEDEVEQIIQEFTDVANKLNEFESYNDDESEEENDESEEYEQINNNFEEENDEFDNHDYENDDELDENLSQKDFPSSFKSYEDEIFDANDDDESNLDENIEENNFNDELNYSEDDEQEENDFNEIDSFENQFDINDNSQDYSKTNSSFFSSDFEDSNENIDIYYENNDNQYQLEEIEDFDEPNKQYFDGNTYTEDEEIDEVYEEQNSFDSYDSQISYSEDYEPYQSGTFNKDEYDNTFINVKKDDSFSNVSEESPLDAYDIDAIISKNACGLNEPRKNIYERRYPSDSYKQKLSNLSTYSKATINQNETQIKLQKNIEVEDIDTLKLNFEHEGIKIKEYKKSSGFEQPEKTYLLVNKINLIRSLILLFGYIFVLSGMYIILQNSSFSLLNEDFSFKYFLIGFVPFIIIAIYNLAIYIINPYKKTPARFASRIMIFLSVIITVQLLLITYCINLQLGFFSFTQTGYNHLLWIIPSIISFAPIISNLVYLALFHSGNFNV